jgi:hypothetical protein
MYETKDVLEGARAIRPYLKELLEATQAAEIDQELAQLLAQSQVGQKVDNRILKLLANYEGTRTWTAAFLEHNLPPQLARLYLPPPGRTNPIPGVMRYICPEGDYVWYRRSVGEPIPQCPTHQLDLVRSDPARVKGPS